jgi:hypothetical protein
MQVTLKCPQCGKKFKPRKGLEKKQYVCGEACLVNKFDLLVRKTRAIARIYAKTLNYRSMSEVRYAARLQKAGIDFEYEPDTFSYQFAPQKYTPDFKIGNTYFEYKGKLDADTRKKLRAIKKSNPDLDLRLVFEKPRNLIRKRKTPTEKVSRYFEWAEKNNFLWYDARDVLTPKADLKKKHKELKNA